MRLKQTLIAVIMFLGITWVADISVATLATRDLVNRVGRADFLAGLEERVSIGMTRQNVENVMLGFRRSTVDTTEEDT
jgi:hypothetical protein